MKSVRLFWFSFLVLSGSMGVAQSNPVPFVSQPLVPSAASPGSAGFSLTVKGAGFASGATVDWNGTPLPTTFVSPSKLTAAVPAADVAANGTGKVTVVNPGPGGGSSDQAFFTISASASSLVFRSSSLSGVTSPLSAVTADFNHDGIPDMAVIDQAAAPSCNYQFHGTGSIITYLGNGDGTFTKNAALCLVDYLGTEPEPLALATDWDRDGNIDLIWLTNSVSVGTHIAVYHGNGNGTFGAAQELYPFTAGAQPRFAAASTLFPDVRGIAAGDFYGNGTLSLAVSQIDTNGFNSIFLVPERGSLPAAPFRPVGPLVASDFDGDGKLDLAEGGVNLTVFLNAGGGVFVQKSDTPLGSAGLVTGDFNGDGFTDLATVQGNTVTVLLGNGDGTFTPKTGQPASSQTNSALITADINGDGKLDLAVVDSTGVVSVWLGKGDGTFQSPMDTTGRGDSVIASDFNGDGKMDLAVTNSTTGVVYILLQGKPYHAIVESPIDADGSSVFPARRHRLPLKFSLTENGVATCTMPSASVAVTRTAGRNIGPLSERAFIAPGDRGTSFRIDRGTCQYVYILNAQSMGTGTYRVDIDISGAAVGDAVFSLR